MKNSNRNWQDRQWNEDSNNQNRHGSQPSDRYNDAQDRYNSYDDYSTGASSWDRDEQDYRGHARSMNDKYTDNAIAMTTPISKTSGSAISLII